jgi:hypothetical protein
MSEEPLTEWDWRIGNFKPPFTAEYDKETGNVCIRGCRTDGGYHWYIVRGFSVPKGQRRLFAQNMKALIEMRYTQEKQNELR